MGKAIKLLILMLVFALFSSCAENNLSDDTQSNVETESETVTETVTEEKETVIYMDEKLYSYDIEEINCDYEEKSIYGVAYRPQREGRLPLVIFSHGLGDDHKYGIKYAQFLAEHGCAVYIYDFCGGSVGENKSSGTNEEMSIMTESEDLTSVLTHALTWDFVNPDKVFLMGESQGGAVSCVVGCKDPRITAGLILIYPALSVPEYLHVLFGSVDNIPDDFVLFGDWMSLSKKYAEDIWDYDFYEELKGYDKPVLLIHGEYDLIVNAEYSRRAAQIIPDCEYHELENTGHEINEVILPDVNSYILDYLMRVVNSGKDEQKSISPF